MEILVCRDCQRSKASSKRRLLCWLCTEVDNGRGGAGAAARARNFAKTGGRKDGEGEGKHAAQDDDRAGNVKGYNMSDHGNKRKR